MLSSISTHQSLLTHVFPIEVELDHVWLFFLGVHGQVVNDKYRLRVNLCPRLGLKKIMSLIQLSDICYPSLRQKMSIGLYKMGNYTPAWPLRLRLRFIADTLPISVLRLAYENNTEKTYSGDQPSQLIQNTVMLYGNIWIINLQ